MTPKPAKKKARPRKAALTPAQLRERDPWHFRRQEDPVFMAILKVLLEHPKLVYYTVDWRPFYFGKADCPKEAALLKVAAKQGRPMVPDPDPICGSYFRAYPRGGGYAERFASAIVDMAVGITVVLPDGTERTLSAGGCGRAGIDYPAEDGYRKWKRLPNGIDVWVLKYKATYASGRHYEARYGAPSGRRVRAGHVRVGTLGLPDGGMPTGEIAGLYSYVQGRDAPCTTPEAWIAELAKLTIIGPPAKVSDAVVAKLRDGHEAGLEAQRKRLGEAIYDDDGNFIRRRRTPKPPQRVRSFERMLRDAGFTPRLLGLFDREVERQQAKAAKAAANSKTNPNPRRKQCTPSPSSSRTRTKPSPGSSRRGVSARSRSKQASATRTRSTAPRTGGRTRATSSSPPRSARRPGSSSRSAPPRTTTRSNRAAAGTRRTGTARSARARANMTPTARASGSPRGRS